MREKEVKVAFIDNSIDTSIYNPQEHWKPYLGVAWDSFKATESHFPDLKKGYTHLILSGGEASIIERESWVYEEIEKYQKKKGKKKYILRIIHPILENLPKDLKVNYPELVEESAKYLTKYGPYPDVFISHMPRFFEPYTEFMEDLADKTPDELILYLNTWSPTGEKMFGSRFELGEALSEHLAQNPEMYLELLDKFSSISKFYLLT